MKASFCSRARSAAVRKLVLLIDCHPRLSLGFFEGPANRALQMELFTMDRRSACLKVRLPLGKFFFHELSVRVTDKNK